MIAKSDNISFNIDLLNECIEEVSSPIRDRSRFFDSLVMERLDKCNKSCIEDFSNKLDIIDSKLERNNFNMREIFSVVKKLTKASSSVYSTQITLFKLMNGK